MEIKEFENKLINNTFTENELQGLLHERLFTKQWLKIPYEIMKIIPRETLYKRKRDAKAVIKYKDKEYTIQWVETAMSDDFIVIEDIWYYCMQNPLQKGYQIKNFKAGKKHYLEKNLKKLKI